MDLGIAGRKAIICASSSGLGLACATALAREGCDVVINGRNSERLEAATKAIRGLTGASARAIVADLDTIEGRRSLLADGSPDILVTNNAGPTPGRFEHWSRSDWNAALEASLLAPLELIQACVPAMTAKRFGRIVNITSARVKTPTARMALSTVPRTALTALAKALAAEVVAQNVTINNLLPERIDTDRQRYMAEELARKEGITIEQAWTRFARAIPAQRFGRPEEFGDACAYLCSAQAGYITGQNIHVDGGSYTGLI
jgi:3-oxoacyl-[acyl-carrier protein] reductase